MSRKPAVPWSPEEDAKLKELVKTDMTFEQIGFTLGRNPGSVCSHLALLGISRRGARRKEATGALKGTVTHPRPGVTVHTRNWTE